MDGVCVTIKARWPPKPGVAASNEERYPLMLGSPARERGSVQRAARLLMSNQAARQAIHKALTHR
jgi:hypothetical protein